MLAAWLRAALATFAAAAETQDDVRWHQAACARAPARALYPCLGAPPPPPPPPPPPTAAAARRELLVTVCAANAAGCGECDLVLAVPSFDAEDLKGARCAGERVLDERFAAMPADWMLAHLTQQDVRHRHILFLTTPAGVGAMRRAVSSTDLERGGPLTRLRWARGEGWSLRDPAPPAPPAQAQAKGEQAEGEVEVVTPAAARAMRIRAALGDADLGIERTAEEARCLFVLRTTEWTRGDQLAWTRMARRFAHALVWAEPLRARDAQVMAAVRAGGVPAERTVSVSATALAGFEHALEDHLSIEPGLAQLAARVPAGVDFVWVLDGAQWTKAAIALALAVPAKADFVATHVASQSAEPSWYWFSQPVRGADAPPLHQRYKSYLQIFRLSVRALRLLARARSWSAHRELFVPTACFQEQLVVGDNLPVSVRQPELAGEAPYVECARAQ